MYQPDRRMNRILDTIWWAIFLVLIALLFAAPGKAEGWKPNYLNPPDSVYQDTGQQAPPVDQPAFAPFPRLPPLGTTSCRSARVCDAGGACRWVDICS